MILSDTLERMWEKEAVAYFNANSQYLTVAG
jgi:hypothetical protein